MDVRPLGGQGNSICLTYNQRIISSQTLQNFKCVLRVAGQLYGSNGVIQQHQPINPSDMARMASTNLKPKVYKPLTELDLDSRANESSNISLSE